MLSKFNGSDKNTESILKMLQGIADASQSLRTQVQGISNNNTDKEYQQLREQNAQLQTLVKNLGNQLF